MIIGYGKLKSRPDPTTVDRLRQDLIEAGAETVFVDVAPLWPQTNEPAASGLEAALQSARSGDVLLALTPAHLTDSVASLIDVAHRLTGIGASLRVLQLTGGQTLDTGTQAGAMLLTALGLMAAFDSPPRPERNASPLADSEIGRMGASIASRTLQMHETPESFAPRRPRGRPPTATVQASEIARLRATGMRATDIAERLKICRASVYRVLNLTHPVGAPSAAENLPASAPTSEADRADRPHERPLERMSNVRTVC